MEHEEGVPTNNSMSENDQDAAKAAGWNMWSADKRTEALKSFVKDRTVDVSNVLRKLSAKMEDLDREVFDKGFDYMVHRINKPTDSPVEHVERAPSLSMKGRIVFFSTSGCEDCRAVRSFLRKKGLPYIEINVDIYPHRKLELEERTGTSSLPQVFFNEVFIGGIHELKAMEASRELDEKLKPVFELESPATAPQPPVPGEEIKSLAESKDDLADIANKLKEKAVGLGKKLGNKFFFQHVLLEKDFQDENHLYRFLEHDPVVLSYCFNFDGTINMSEPKSAKEMEISFRKVSQAIVEQYISEDGRHVDYEGISKSAEFKRYLSIAHQLHRVNLLGLTREEKLAFFINLYNAMAIHAVIALGHPDGPLDRRKFFGDFQYLVGGSPFSLSAIENGVLRGNQRPPYSFIKSFGPKDNRLKISLQEPTPLVHFALSCATRSSPPVNSFTPENIDAELRFAARSFFREGGFKIDMGTKTITLSQIMNWYNVDFGSSELEMLKWIADYLEPAKAEVLLQLLEGEYKVVYEAYDWSPNF
ncbi:hypothetical protein KP509_30G031600 [Ceratopteris richardii]|uniref:Uncharacterized protein n=1 Tax=Ceratopteris richardii TaxID=49495 RepID=A0A8T2R3I0_CERRI|nr:hypothetical protein KP509_30G031600 [Ceratopteris richardii]